MNHPAKDSGNFFTQDGKGTSPLRLIRNSLLTGLCISLSLLTLVPLLSIVMLVVKNGMPLVSPALFTQLPPPPGLEEGGFANAIIGTVIMVGIALLLAIPLGILAAIHITEYAPASRLSQAVRFVAKLLTGIPSIICGVFAFAAVVMTMRCFSAFAGGVAPSILILPTILLTAEQALAFPTPTGRPPSGWEPPPSRRFSGSSCPMHFRRS